MSIFKKAYRFFRTIFIFFGIAVVSMTTVAAQAAESALVVSTFSSATPSGNSISTRVDLVEKKEGLASAALDYQLDGQGRAELLFAPTAFRVPAPGLLRFWLKGDKSGNKVTFIFRESKAIADPVRETRYEGIKDRTLPPVTLDFDDWRELSFDFKDVAREQHFCFRGVQVERAEQSPEPILKGTLWMDEMTVVPSVGLKPSATATVGLLGSRMRIRDDHLVVAVDLRNFTDKPVRAKIRMSLADWNDTPMADRDLGVDLAPGEVTEVAVPVVPEDFSPFLPPFRLHGDVLSPDVPELNGWIDETMVFANSYLLFEPFADVYGGWGTRGTPERHVTVSEAYRFTGLPQSGLRLSRTDIVPVADGETQAPGRYAMRVEFEQSGPVFNMRTPARRYLPGDAFRAGFWIKGDGSGARISAILQDFSDMADFYEGGWKRVRSEAFLCTLDFTGWRYIEVGLPGGGILMHSPKGSTPEVDAPLELAGFTIEAAKVPEGPKDANGQPLPGEKKIGVVEFGPVFIHTQQRAAEALAVFAAYDDAEHQWAGDRAAWAVVQNGWPGKNRKVQLQWSLMDRAGVAVSSGAAEAELKPEELRTLRLDLPAQAAKAQKAEGPLRLQVIVSDATDSPVSVDQEIILSKSDSRALFADFEQNRSYSACSLAGFGNVSDQTVAGRTTDKVAHSGTSSLELNWSATNGTARLVSIDPPLPGIPTMLSLWVFGDGSSVQFYPLIGDRNGVSKGIGRGQWDVFTLRTVEPESHDVVTVDWTGWRQLTFRMPMIPPEWNLDLPVLSFVPSYPLGLHLVVRPGSATSVTDGTLYVDDIVVETHLLPAERVGFRLDQPGESDVLSPGGELAAWVWNADAKSTRNITLTGALLDWRGRVVCSSETALELTPGESKRVVTVSAIPQGAYTMNVDLREGKDVRVSSTGDLLVADLSAVLSADWHEALSESARLRSPIGSLFEVVDEDWDWVEHYPGNFQSTTVRAKSIKVRKQGGDPFVLLGYSAYWAAGEGFQARQANAFSRRSRDAGHAVDIFLRPELLEDWNDYVGELMRAAGGDVAGWVLWDNPDGAGPLAMKPESFTPLLNAAWYWRGIYCPDKPLLIGGMQRETAVAYLEGLGKTNALHNFSGIQVRLDLGRLSPEDAQLERFIGELQVALESTPENPRPIFFTDLDWAVEKGNDGLSVFDQAGYLARATLLLNRFGYQPTVTVANGDFDRFGLGVAYKQIRQCPPMSVKPATMFLKPGWWGLANLLGWCREMELSGVLDIQDVCAGRTFGLLYRLQDGRSAVIVWRNDDSGILSFSETGCEVVGAEDVFGSPVPNEQGGYGVVRIPVRFLLTAPDEKPNEALSRLRIRDTEGPASWSQQTLASFTPDTGNRFAYHPSGGTQAVFTGRTAWGEPVKREGLRFAPGGSETFEVSIPEGAGLVLRKEYLLDQDGQMAEVLVDGKQIGSWNLMRTSPDLSSGLREAVFPIDASALAGKTKIPVEIRYPNGGTTVRWVAFDYRGGAFPLTAVGAVHADQTVGAPRAGRNMVGGALKIGEERFENGIGCFAMSLQEFSLGGRFKRFTAKVGVDAVTEGRGSVVFEVYGDGLKLWSSPTMSGLDRAYAVDVPVEGVDRIRLVVSDAGDGNRYDVADWCDPVLQP